MRMTAHLGGTDRRLTESNRVEAFSDGVFAIALTLLVLDLHAPTAGSGGFAHQLAGQWPAYVAYLAAFLEWTVTTGLSEQTARIRELNAELRTMTGDRVSIGLNPHGSASLRGRSVGSMQ